MPSLTIPEDTDNPGQRAIPQELKGSWCELILRGFAGPGSRGLIYVDRGTEEAIFPHLVGPGKRLSARAILYIPADARALRIEQLGRRKGGALVVSARRLARPIAAARLFARAPARVLRASAGGREGLWRRLRTGLVHAIGDDPHAHSYEVWSELFDYWPPAVIARLKRAAGAEMRVFVIGDDADHPDAQATLESLKSQARPLPFRFVPAGSDLASALAEGAEPYIGILGAGEILRPHASALVEAWIAAHGAPLMLYADEDRTDPHGARTAPHFKPEPNRALMLSGTLAHGLWVVRRERLVRCAPVVVRSAAGLRLDLWFRAHETGQADKTRRIPFVLTSVPAPRQDRGAMEAIRAHLERIGQTAEIAARGDSVRVRPALSGGERRPVAIIVPSALRAPHVRRCLAAVVERTGHSAFEVVVVVTQPAPLDPAQRETLAALGNRHNLRVLQFNSGSFNYAAANNYGVRAVNAEFVCLLNDDVAPTERDWLQIMLGHMSDPRVGAVGARLLYDNGTVQHGGIIMGMGGLADHAHRFLPREEPGYAGRAILNQELSACTGACLLVRRSAYEEVGGMDETFPIAFNDVDFCLRLREAGHSVVYCADAELIHYESLSLGHHFSGARAAIESIEVQRMRRRWPDAVRADPFHNPNLSLVRGHEWEVSFPPRVRQTEYLD